MKKFLIIVGAIAALVLAAQRATAQLGPNTQSFNCSGTMAVGGTAQNAFGTSATRRGFYIVNLSANPMWINLTGTAAIGTEGSNLLIAGSATTQGGSFTAQQGMGVANALSVVSANTGDKYTCWFW